MGDLKLKIRAGETFLYRKGGTESQVFELRLKDNVSYRHLFRAAKIAFKRYPYFNSRFKIIDGDVYLCEKSVLTPPAQTKKLRPLGGSTTAGNLLDITFWGRSIWISFHHAMCDGRGIMQFIKTLMYYYLNFLYKYNNIRIPDVRLAGEPLLAGETADPVTEGNLEFDKEKVFMVDRTAFPIPEVQRGEDAGGSSWRYEITFNVHEVMSVCRKYNCTPAILISILMQKGIKSQYPSASEPILCNMTCDWRESIGLPDTFRNCVSSIYLPYGESEQVMTMSELGGHYRELIAKQKEPDSAKCNASVMKYMSDMLDSLGSYEKKQEAVSGFVSKPVNSFVCSYTGRANMGDAERYIDSIHVYASGTKGILVQMMSVGDTFTVDIQQNFEAKTYVDAMLCEAAHVGLTACCSDVIPYVTPKDHMENTNFVKSLISLFK